MRRTNCLKRIASKELPQTDCFKQMKRREAERWVAVLIIHHGQFIHCKRGRYFFFTGRAQFGSVVCDF